jgi:hypothetical protein
LVNIHLSGCFGFVVIVKTHVNEPTIIEELTVVSNSSLANISIFNGVLLFIIPVVQTQEPFTYNNAQLEIDINVCHVKPATLKVFDE